MLQQETTYKISNAEFLERGIAYATEHEFSFACWQLPKSATTWLLISKNQPTAKEVSVEHSISGFCVSPYLNNNLTNSYFFEADILYRIERQSITPLQSSDEFESYVSEKQVANSYYYSTDSFKNTTKADYETSVQDAIEAVEQNDLQKVVLSKTKSVPLPHTINLVAKYAELTDSYPNAFVSLISSRTTGTWIGATPETLISIDKDQVFKTVALAGTQPASEYSSAKEAVWTQKEIEEQALVSRYIIHCLKEIRLREFEDIGPKTVKAGNLFHLKTEFKVDMKAINFPNLGSTMLRLLHPTSAVCGMPKQKAQAFIQQHELHDRKLYSGFLGPVNINNETYLFVNLRCAQITKKEIILYAGAGITEDSVPEKEWEETEDKCSTLEKILLI